MQLYVKCYLLIFLDVIIIIIIIITTVKSAYK